MNFVAVVKQSERLKVQNITVDKKKKQPCYLHKSIGNIKAWGKQTRLI